MRFIRRYESTIYGNYKQKILLNGFIVGLVLCVLVLSANIIGAPIDRPAYFLQNVILILVMFLLTFFYRKGLVEKKLMLKEAFLLNLGMGLLAAAIYGLFLWYYITYIDIEFIERFIDWQLRQYVKAGKSPSQIEEMSQSLHRFLSPPYIAVRAFMEIGILSIMYALVVGIFLRTERNKIREKK